MNLYAGLFFKINRVTVTCSNFGRATVTGWASVQGQRVAIIGVPRYCLLAGPAIARVFELLTPLYFAALFEWHPACSNGLLSVRMEGRSQNACLCSKSPFAS